jgi:hypothetical protein
MLHRRVHALGLFSPPNPKGRLQVLGSSLPTRTVSTPKTNHRKWDVILFVLASILHVR